MQQLENKKPKPLGRRWWFRLLRSLAVIYIGLCVTLFFMQSYLIFPGASTQGTAGARVAQGKHYDLLSLRAPDGTKIAAVFGAALDESAATPPDPAQRTTLIYFYGNGACMAYSMDVFSELRGRGFNVIIPDYEGYGMSGGKPSETGCYAAADAAYDYLLSRPDIGKDKIALLGWSLGGAVAFDLATRRPVTGVATLSAFTSMKDMAHNLIPWLPTSLLLRHHFDNLAKIRTLRCPIFIGHGTRDTIVPPKMAERLAAAATAPVTLVHVQNADHNDIFETGGDPLFDQLQHFFDGL